MRGIQRPIYFVRFRTYVDGMFPRPAWRHKRRHFLWGVPVFSSTLQRPWARTILQTPTAVTPISSDAVAVLSCGLRVTNAAAALVSWYWAVFVVYSQLFPKCLTDIDRRLRPLQARCRPYAGVPWPSWIETYIKCIQMSRPFKAFLILEFWAVLSSRKQSKHLT